MATVSSSNFAGVYPQPTTQHYGQQPQASFQQQTAYQNQPAPLLYSPQMHSNGTYPPPQQQSVQQVYGVSAQPLFYNPNQPQMPGQSIPQQIYGQVPNQGPQSQQPPPSSLPSFALPRVGQPQFVQPQQGQQPTYQYIQPPQSAMQFQPQPQPQYPMMPQQNYNNQQPHVVYGQPPPSAGFILPRPPPVVVAQPSQQVVVQTAVSQPQVPASHVIVAPPHVEGSLIFAATKSFKIKQKWFSFSGAMEVTDADLNTKVFKVKPKILTLLDSIKITDMKDDTFLRIEQSLSFMPVFKILNRHDQQIAECKKKFTFTKDKFKVKVFNGPDLHVTGKWYNHEFTIKADGRLVAEVSKAWYSWTDSYALRVQPGTDCAMCLAICVIVDRVLHDQRED